jgi:hypothetical protein
MVLLIFLMFLIFLILLIALTFWKASILSDQAVKVVKNVKASCGGYIVDQIIPLKRGARGDPSNIEWQTLEPRERSVVPVISA